MTLRFWGAAFFAFAAMGSLFGCGGQVNGVSPSGAAGARSTSHAGPLAHGAGRKLLYVVSYPSVNVYTYPQDSLLGSLGSGGEELCTDQQGDVFVTGGSASTVTEYAHGSVVPKVTLQDPYFAGACSVDPTTGSVAVVSSSTFVVVFPYNKRKGWRFARVYPISNMAGAVACTYDPSGNLYVDGYAPGSVGIALDELPKGANAFAAISLNHHLTGPGGLQWEGSYIAVASGGPKLRGTVVIYEFAINGSSGTEIGSIRLRGSTNAAEYWIQGGHVIGQYIDPSINGVAIWRYPHGGEPIKTFAPQTEAYSVVVSVP